MAVDNVTTSSATGIDGNAYTTAVSNDQLTNNDFLTLMLEEMKQQDPTKPMDSAALMDSQLKMSTIQANQDMASAMVELQKSYATSALSTAANMIGHSIKTGELDDQGEEKIFKVVTVDNIDGELYVKAQEFTGVMDGLKNTETNEIANNNDGSIKLLDSNNEVITDEDIKSKYAYGGYSLLYSEDTIEIPLNSIKAVS